MQGIEGVACDGNTICAIVDGTLSLWNGTGWTALQGYALGHLDYAFAVVGEGYASLGTNDMQYVPFTEAGSLPTLTIRRLHQRGQHRRGFPAGLSRRGRITRRRPLTYGAAGGRGHRRRR